MSRHIAALRKALAPIQDAAVRGERDGKFLDDIAEMLRDPDWGVGMLEDIADLVRATGRPVENYPDDRSTWARH